MTTKQEPTLAWRLKEAAIQGAREGTREFFAPTVFLWKLFKRMAHWVMKKLSFKQ